MASSPAENFVPMIRALRFHRYHYWARIKVMIRILLVHSPLRHFGPINRARWFACTVRDLKVFSGVSAKETYTPLHSEDRMLYRWMLPPATEGDPGDLRRLERRSDKKLALIAPALLAATEPDDSARQLQAYLLDQGLQASIHLVEDEEQRASFATLFNAAVAELKDSCDYFVFQPLSLIPETADYRWAEALLSLAEYCRTIDGDCYQLRYCPAVLLAPKELLLAVNGFGEGPLEQALPGLLARASAQGYDTACDTDGFFHWREAAPNALALADSEPTEFLGGLSTLKVLGHRQDKHRHYQHHRLRLLGAN